MPGVCKYQYDGVDWSCTISLAVDDALLMTRKKAGVVTMSRKKVQNANGGDDFWTFHSIMHQEALWCESLGMDWIMS